MSNTTSTPFPADVKNNTITVSVPDRGNLFFVAKRVIQFGFTLLAVPRLLAWSLSRIVLGRRAFIGSSESIARIPGLRGVYLRQAFYRATLSNCGQDTYFGWHSVFSMTDATIGDRCYIGRFCSIGYAKIGPEAMISDGVQILSGGREHNRSGSGDTTMHEMHQTYRQVEIGEGAWIGARSVVMADVGKHAIVGAGSVVTKPIPANCVAVGSPARVIKNLNETN